MKVEGRRGGEEVGCRSAPGQQEREPRGFSQFFHTDCPALLNDAFTKDRTDHHLKRAGTFNAIAH